MNDDDRKTMDYTARMGGMKSAAPEPVPSTSISTGKIETATNDAIGPASLEPRDDHLNPAKRFARNDLRPQISPTSKLAEALEEMFGALDPTTRKFVKPALVLKDLLAEYDDDLAKLLRKKMAGQ